MECPQLGRAGAWQDVVLGPGTVVVWVAAAASPHVLDVPGSELTGHGCSDAVLHSLGD